MLVTLATALAALLSAPAPCATVPHQETVVAGELGARMDRYLTRLAALGFSGSALVEREGELVLSKGYGFADRAGGVANGPSTVVSMGSITKHFTAALVLKLESEGLLTTEDTLDLFFPDAPADKAKITLHQLLTHTSGLPDGAQTVLAAGDREDFVASALSLRLQARPGSEMSYTNLGYGLLAAIVEVVTDGTYEKALRERLLDPAGMTRSGLDAGRWPPAELAHGYIDGRDTGTLMEGRGLTSWGIRGSGGLHTTPLDMRAWNRALDAGEILSAEALAKMTTRHAPMGPDMAYGYGVGVRATPRGTTSVGHSGSNDVFCALFERLPEERALIYVQSNDADVYAEDVAPRLEALLFGGEVPDPPQVVALAGEVLAAYAGAWSFEEGGSIVVAAEPGRLLLGSADPRGSSLVHPVRREQVARRDALLGEVELAYGLAFEGELEPLRELIAPYAPPEAFADRQAEQLEALTQRHGPFVAAATAAGRNRFGEVAIVAALEFERGRALLEISFGEEEVGSFRLLEGFPERVVRATSPSDFVSYDPQSGESWRVRFELDGDGLPEALVLFDEAGREHVATR